MRIPEAVSPATLPPETTTATVAPSSAGTLPARRAATPAAAGGLGGELGPLVEEAEPLLDLLLGDQDGLDPELEAERDRKRAREGRVQAVGDRVRRHRDGRAGGEAVVEGAASPRARPRPHAFAARAAAIPETSPPPPTGTTTTSTSGRSSAISRPTVPWPGDHERVVERVDERAARFLLELRRGARRPRAAPAPPGRRSRRTRGRRRASARSRPAT